MMHLCGARSTNQIFTQQEIYEAHSFKALRRFSKWLLVRRQKVLIFEYPSCIPSFTADKGIFLMENVQSRLMRTV